MSRRTIIAIDDLQESLDLYESLIRKHLTDVDCVCVLDGKQGIEKAMELQPDLILVDAKLPGIDGFEVSRRLKEEPRTARVPVLMVSGVLTEREHRISGLASGADGYICKPFQSQEFIAEINVLLRIKDYEDQLRLHEQELEDKLEQRTGDLIESEARFRVLFENSPDAIFVESRDLTVIDVNKAGCALNGLNRSELVGMSVLDLVPHSMRNQVENDFNQLFTEESQFFESYSLNSSGTVIPVEIRSRRISYKNQEAAILIVRDISRRKKVETALNRVAKDVSPLTGFSFFYSLVQQLCEVLEVDFALFTTFDGANHSEAESIAFCGDGQILENVTFRTEGTPLLKMSPRHVLRVESGFGKAYPAADFFNELKTDSYVGFPLQYSNGSVLGTIQIFHRTPLEDTDLASSILQIFGARTAAEFERMQATENLWESEERYRSLSEDVLNRSVVGIFVLDRNYRIAWSNQTARDYFQGRGEALHGQDMRQFVSTRFKRPVDPTGEFRQRLASSYEKGEYLAGETLYIAPTSGSPPQPERWLEYFSQPIRSGLYAGGRIEHFTDITQQKSLQDQLLQVQKMEGIGRLAGGVAHDFNNLLTTILGFSNLILDDLDEASPMRQAMEEIIHAGQRAEKLTRQLLVFGRKQLVQIRPIDLNEVVRDMEKLLRRTLGEDLELETECQEALPAVEADPGQLEQVIMNLAVNARDAMPKGGRLCIRTATMDAQDLNARNVPFTEEGNFVRLTIQDNGFGMPQEVAEHAFEPFFTTKDQDKGTGLGLSIVYGIIQQFGGHIDLTSKPDSGTTFDISLPPSNRKAVSLRRKPRRELPQGTETILVVEDEETVRHLTVRILSSLGYTVLEAEGGPKALTIFEEAADTIDLVMTDVVMPHMSGTELIRTLRERYGEKFKVLFSSGFTEDTLEGHGISTDDSNLILKPYTRESLAQAVHDILHRDPEDRAMTVVRAR